MTQVRARGSLIEKLFASALRKRQIKFRGHAKNLIGCPDFVLPDSRIAVFCDSHFWHGYNWKNRRRDHKSNKKFWIKKIEANIARDKLVSRQLKTQGWKVLRFWEHQIKLNLSKCLDKVEDLSATKTHK